MSLDVYLTIAKCPHCGRAEEPVFEANVTHNLGKMAREAGIHDPVWYPKDVEITKASQLIKPLEASIAVMKEDPERFKKFDAMNGWGTYEQFVPWLERYLDACREHPDAEVHASP